MFLCTVHIKIIWLEDYKIIKIIWLDWLLYANKYWTYIIVCFLWVLFIRAARWARWGDNFGDTVRLSWVLVLHIFNNMNRNAFKNCYNRTMLLYHFTGKPCPGSGTPWSNCQYVWMAKLDMKERCQNQMCRYQQHCSIHGLLLDLFFVGNVRVWRGIMLAPGVRRYMY